MRWGRTPETSPYSIFWSYLCKEEKKWPTHCQPRALYTSSNSFHVLFTACLNLPTFPCPILSVSSEPISEAHHAKWHNQDENLKTSLDDWLWHSCFIVYGWINQFPWKQKKTCKHYYTVIHRGCWLFATSMKGNTSSSKRSYSYYCSKGHTGINTQLGRL